MFSYRVDLNPILEIVGGWVDASGSLVLDHLTVGEETFRARGPAQFDVSVSNAGEGIVLRGTATYPVVAKCARCLRDFDSELNCEVEGLYLGPGDEAPEEDEAVPVGRDGFVDIGPAIMAALVVDAPFAPLHDPDCPGLCPNCGADLNVGSCPCNPETDEIHPFAALKDLLGPSEN